MMGEILLHWIEKKLGLYLPHISDDVRFRRSVSNCHLIGEILRKYNIISDDQCIALHKDLYESIFFPCGSVRSSTTNIRNLYRWLSSSGFGVSFEDLQSIVEGKPGAAIKLMYRLYLWLEAPKEYPLHGKRKFKCLTQSKIMGHSNDIRFNSLQSEDQNASTSRINIAETPQQNETSDCLPFRTPVLLNVVPYNLEKTSHSRHSCLKVSEIASCEPHLHKPGRETAHAMTRGGRHGHVRDAMQEMMDYDRKELNGGSFVDHLMAETARYYTADDKKLQFERIYTATQLRLACSLAHRYQEDIVGRVFLNTSREGTIINLVNMSHDLKRRLTNHMKEASANTIQEMQTINASDARYKQNNLDSCRFVMNKQNATAKAAASALRSREASSHEGTGLKVAHEILSDILDVVVDAGDLKEFSDEYPDTNAMMYSKLFQNEDTLKIDEGMPCGSPVINLIDTAAVHAYIFRERNGMAMLDRNPSDYTKASSNGQYFGLEQLVSQLLNAIYPSQIEEEVPRLPNVKAIVTLSGLSMQWEANKVQDAVMKVIGQDLRIIDAANVVEQAIAAWYASQEEHEKSNTYYAQNADIREEEIEGEFHVLWSQAPSKAILKQKDEADGVQVHPTRVQSSGRTLRPTRSSANKQPYLTEQKLHEAVKANYGNEELPLLKEEDELGMFETAKFRDAATDDDLQLLFSPEDVPESWPYFVALGKQALREMLEYGIVPSKLVAQLIVERMCHYPPDAYVLILNYPNGISEALALDSLLQGQTYNGFEESLYADTLFEDVRSENNGALSFDGQGDLLKKPGLNLFRPSPTELPKGSKNCFRSSLQSVIIAEALSESDVTIEDFPSNATAFDAIVGHSNKKLQEMYSIVGSLHKLNYQATSDCYQNLANIFKTIEKQTESAGEDDFTLNGEANHNTNRRLKGVEICTDGNSSDFRSLGPEQDGEGQRVNATGDSMQLDKSISDSSSFFAGLSTEFLKEVSDFWIIMERCYVEGLYGIMAGFRQSSERLTRHLVQSKRFYENIFEEMSAWDHVLNRFICEFNSIAQPARWDPEVKAHLHNRISELKLRTRAYCIEHYEMSMRKVDVVENDPVYETELCYVAGLYSSLIQHEVDRYNDTISFLCDIMHAKKINVPVAPVLGKELNFEFASIARTNTGGTKRLSWKVPTSLQAQFSTVNDSNSIGRKQKRAGKRVSLAQRDEDERGPELSILSKNAQSSTNIFANNDDDMKEYKSYHVHEKMGECSTNATQFLTELCDKLLQDLASIESVSSKISPKLSRLSSLPATLDIASKKIRTSVKRSVTKSNDGIVSTDKSERRKSPKKRQKRGKSTPSPKAKSPKAKNPETKNPKDKSPETKNSKAKSPKKKSPKDESPKAKSPKKKSPRDESPKAKSPKAKKSKHKKNMKEEDKLEHSESDRTNGYPATVNEVTDERKQHDEEQNLHNLGMVFVQCVLEEGNRLRHQITFVQNESSKKLKKIHQASNRLKEGTLKNAAAVLQSQLQRIETVCDSWDTLVEIGTAVPLREH